jgi:hypothetical protein
VESALEGRKGTKGRRGAKGEEEQFLIVMFKAIKKVSIAMPKHKFS